MFSFVEILSYGLQSLSTTDMTAVTPLNKVRRFERSSELLSATLRCR